MLYIPSSSWQPSLSLRGHHHREDGCCLCDGTFDQRLFRRVGSSWVSLKKIMGFAWYPPANHHKSGNSPFWVGKSTISMGNVQKQKYYFTRGYQFLFADLLSCHHVWLSAQALWERFGSQSSSFRPRSWPQNLSVVGRRKVCTNERMVETRSWDVYHLWTGDSDLFHPQSVGKLHLVQLVHSEITSE